jgi:hypothetical protein
MTYGDGALSSGASVDAVGRILWRMRNINKMPPLRIGRGLDLGISIPARPPTRPAAIVTRLLSSDSERLAWVVLALGIMTIGLFVQ